jgi:molybdopterin converting factor small subunit
MAVIWVPALARGLVGGAEAVQAAGCTVGEVMDALEARYPGIRAALWQPWVLVSVDGAVAELGLAEPVGESSEVLFVPAISGGQAKR